MEPIDGKRSFRETCLDVGAVGVAGSAGSCFIIPGDLFVP
jgi:hypothetical protein